MKSILAVLCLVGVLLAATDAQRFRVRRQVDEEDASPERVEGREVEEGDPAMLIDCISPGGVNHVSCGTWWWEWSDWSACSKSCGGGTRTRNGERWCNCKTWTHGNLRCVNINDHQTEGCEQWCVNGQFNTISGTCNCNTGYTGYCCELRTSGAANAEVVEKLRQAQGREAQDKDVRKAPVPHVAKAKPVPVAPEAPAPEAPAPEAPAPEARVPEAPAPEVHAAAPGPQAPASRHGSSAGVIAAGCIVALVALVAATAIIAVVVKKRNSKARSENELSVPNPAYES